MPETTTRCENCEEDFHAKRSTARYCGSTCRKAAHRAKAKESQPVSEFFASSYFYRDEELWGIFNKAIDENRILSKRRETPAIELLGAMITNQFHQLLNRAVDEE